MPARRGPCLWRADWSSGDHRFRRVAMRVCGGRRAVVKRGKPRFLVAPRAKKLSRAHTQIPTAVRARAIPRPTHLLPHDGGGIVERPDRSDRHLLRQPMARFTAPCTPGLPAHGRVPMAPIEVQATKGQPARSGCITEHSGRRPSAAWAGFRQYFLHGHVQSLS
jgi:hypothetical protein